MWSLLFILCIALSCVIRAEAVIWVSGYEKADINISCPYDKAYKSNEKYLCRNNCGNDDVLIKTTDKKSNKYSAYDDKKERVFRVKISDLSSKDAGSYWCGVTKILTDHYPARVELEVLPVFQTTTVTSTIIVETVRSQTDPSELYTGASLLSLLVLVSIVVAVVMPLILISALIIICKCKCYRAQVELAGNGVNRSRNTVNTADAEEVMQEGHIYEISDNGVYPKQKASKQLSTCHRYDVIGGDQQDSVYENVTVTDNIYHNLIIDGYEGQR